MGIKLKFTPIGNLVEDKEIIVQGEVKNAREYMEQFEANKKKNIGIDSQNNIFTPKKSLGQRVYIFFHWIVTALCVVAVIKGFFSTPKNEMPMMTIFCFFGLCFFLSISGQLERYFRFQSCTTQVNAIIVGKDLRTIHRSDSHRRRTIMNTVFLVEHNAKVYLLCEKEDGIKYGNVGDIVPVFINSENPFAFYTKQYKKSSFQEFCALFVMICVAGIITFWGLCMR